MAEWNRQWREFNHGVGGEVDSLDSGDWYVCLLAAEHEQGGAKHDRSGMFGWLSEGGNLGEGGAVAGAQHLCQGVGAICAADDVCRCAVRRSRSTHSGARGWQLPAWGHLVVRTDDPAFVKSSRAGQPTDENHVAAQSHDDTVITLARHRSDDLAHEGGGIKCQD